MNQFKCIVPLGYIGEWREPVCAPAGASSLVGAKPYAIMLGLEQKLPLWKGLERRPVRLEVPHLKLVTIFCASLQIHGLH